MQVPKPRRVVGILGGMGPEATILLQQKILEATPADDDADHVPLLVDVNTQVPSRIEALVEGTGESPGPVLVAMARRLEAMGADALAMPCNTAHGYAPQIAAAVTIPFLDMVRLGAAAALAKGGRRARVGLLGSTALRNLRLYEGPLAALGGSVVYPRRQDELMVALKAFKRRAGDPAARDLLGAVARDLMGEGVDVLLVGCTEFSLAVDLLPDGVPAVDALDALVEAILDFARA